jgi:integrase
VAKAEHLGGDRYRVRVYAGRDLRGRPKQVTRTYRAKTQREAERLADRHRADLRDRLTADATHRGTVGGLVDEWEQDHRHLAATSRYRNRSILNTIRGDLGHHQLDALTPRHIERWYATLRDGDHRSESTVHHYHRLLHEILCAGERWGYVAVAPTRKVRPPKRPKPVPRPPDTAQLLAVLESAPRALQVAAALAARLGLRRGELMGIRWGDIHAGILHVQRTVTDVPGQPLTVKQPKTLTSTRTITLDTATIGLLDVWQWELAGAGAMVPDAYIIPNLHGDPTGQTPNRPGWVSLAWRRHCTAQGVRIRFHDLRHWSATNLLDRGVPLPTVAARLGHARTSTTVDVYAAAIRGSDQRAADVMGDLLPDKETQ